MQPVEVKFAPKLEAFHLLLLLSWVSDDSDLKYSIDFPCPLSPGILFLLQVPQVPMTCRGKLGSLAHCHWSPPPTPISASLCWAEYLLGSLPSAHFTPHLPVIFFVPLFRLSVHSSSSNLSLCFYLTLLFFMHLLRLLLFVFWDIPFIVDEAYKLRGRRARGPYSNPHLSFKNIQYSPWKGLFWGQFKLIIL